MKKIFLCLVLAGCISGTKTPEAQATYSGDWEVLFDGESLNGWHRFNHKGIPPIWTAKNGVLTFDPALRPEGDYIHDLISDKEFTSFQLSIEWNIAEGGNSGVFWAVEIRTKKLNRSCFASVEMNGCGFQKNRLKI